MILLYRALLTLAAPLLIGALVWRVLRGTETWADLQERLGRARGGASAQIWLHGASNGELTAARVLLDDLRAAFPEAQIVVTSNTPTARAMMQGWQMHGVEARLAPLDLRWCLRRFLRAHQLRAFILLEGDFWPNRQMMVTRAGLPALLVGGRISAASARSWARFGGLSARVFGSFDKVWPQSAAAAMALADLGAQPIAPVIDLKARYDGAASGDPMFDRSNTWLAASTHEGEDAIVLAAHKLARHSRPDLCLILAPRHPKRAGEIAALAKQEGLSLAQRSAAETDKADVYLADTLGEMPQWYASAHACFVAGSLVPKGGHTPFEPIAHGCAILHGPQTENFAAAYAALDQAEAALQVTDAEALAQAVIALQDETASETLAKRAKNIAIALQNGTSGQNDILETLDKLAFRPSIR